MKKIIALAFTIIVLNTLPLEAQERYTPFSNSLSWHGWGDSFTWQRFPTESRILSNDTLIVDTVHYSRFWGYEGVLGIREDDKKIYVYFSEFGELLLYDFNLQVGDTIFYPFGLGVSMKTSPDLIYQNTEHYSVVLEKGVTTLLNGSTRNTMTLSQLGFGTIQWVEGIGATINIGLLAPLVTDFVLDGTNISLVCICENSGEAACLFFEDYCGSDPPQWYGYTCPCRPNNINEYPESKFSLYPNPTNGHLTIDKGGLQIDNIELFDLFGRQHLFLPILQQSQEITIDISHLANGIYFLKIITESGSQQTQKLVKN